MTRIATIAVEKAGGYNTINISQWMSIPINERITMIARRKVQFLDDSGDMIHPKTAMQLIKHDAAAGQSSIV